MTTRTLSFLGTGAVALTAAIIAGAMQFNAANAAVTISSGDLIRGQSFSAVYYMGADGFRYVFPNDKNYFTWYSDFDDVVFITDAQLAEIPLGDNNVTYKPGVKMIKINTDPRVYVVSAGGVLHHVDSEAIASSLYGSTWNTKIDDVADGFFSNYDISDESAGDVGYSATGATASVTDINDDKGMVAPEEFDITANGFSPIDVTISAGQTVRFTNTDTDNHSITSDDLRWGSGTLHTGESFVRRFSEEGTFTFFDSYDSSNTGAIYVQ
jgi:plastocyanin